MLGQILPAGVVRRVAEQSGGGVELMLAALTATGRGCPVRVRNASGTCPAGSSASTTLGSGAVVLTERIRVGIAIKSAL